MESINENLLNVELFELKVILRLACILKPLDFKWLYYAYGLRFVTDDVGMKNHCMFCLCH